LECPRRVKASQVALKQLTQRAMRLKQITEEAEVSFDTILGLFWHYT